MSNKGVVFSLLMLTVLGVCSMVLVACGGQSGGGGQGQEAQTLRLITFVPKNDVTTSSVPMWIDKIEKGTDGEVKIEWVGGPEAIPQEDQFTAVRDGTVDINMTVAAYYTNEVPEILSVHLSPHTPREERENGYFDYLVQRHEEVSTVYLGRWTSGFPFYLWSNEEIKTLQDFNGKAVRSNPSYHPVLQALGANPVDVGQPDVFTALERGVVQGFAWPVLGPQDYGWTEVTKYIINEPFMAQSATILMNPDALQSLSSENQEKIRELTAEFEPEMRAHFRDRAEQEWEAISDAGVEAIELSSEDSEQFQELWKNAHWDHQEEQAPDQVSELKDLLQVEADGQSEWVLPTQNQATTESQVTN